MIKIISSGTLPVVNYPTQQTIYTCPAGKEVFFRSLLVENDPNALLTVNGKSQYGAAFLLSGGDTINVSRSSGGTYMFLGHERDASILEQVITLYDGTISWPANSAPVNLYTVPVGKEVVGFIVAGFSTPILRVNGNIIFTRNERVFLMPAGGVLSFSPQVNSMPTAANYPILIKGIIRESL
jgi:hypothetical protein